MTTIGNPFDQRKRDPEQGIKPLVRHDPTPTSLRERARGVLAAAKKEQEYARASHLRGRGVKASKAIQMALYERVDPESWVDVGEALETEIENLTFRVYPTGEVALVVKLGKTEKVFPAGSISLLALALDSIGEFEEEE